MKVNPNRMMLLKLRKRLAVARRGHKLLKDKQEELVRRFMEFLDDLASERNFIEKELPGALAGVLVSRSALDGYSAGTAGIVPPLKPEISTDHIMTLTIPRVEARPIEAPADGPQGTSMAWDQAAARMRELAPRLVNLASMEKTAELLAAEIESTRRRVNALEYRLIPDLLDTIKMIITRLNEAERSTISRLMKIKQMASG